MIKLADLLNEEKQEQYVPYMYSPVGFSCNVCRFHYVEDDKHMCSNKDYQAYMGTAELLDNDKNPITDPTKWCSNWFKPTQND